MTSKPALDVFCLGCLYCGIWCCAVDDVEVVRSTTAKSKNLPHHNKGYGTLLDETKATVRYYKRENMNVDCDDNDHTTQDSTTYETSSYCSPFALDAEVEYMHYKSFGGYGQGEGEFHNPCGVTVDDYNNIYVCDYHNHRIQVFDREGNFLDKFGLYGTGEREFKYPYGAVIDDDGRLLVSDAHNSRVQILNCATDRPYFEAQPSLDCEVNTLYGIAVNSKGDIYVCDLSNHQVQVFSNEGYFKFKFGSFGSDEGEFDVACGIAINQLDHVYISDYRNHRIQVFNAKGEYFFSFGRDGTSDGHFHYPSGLAIDRHGNLYVCDEGNCRIQVFDSTGEFLGKLGVPGTKVGQFNHPCGIAVDREDRVIVSNTKNHRVEIFVVAPKANLLVTPLQQSYGSTNVHIYTNADNVKMCIVYLDTCCVEQQEDAS